MQLSPVVTLILSIVFGAAAVIGARLWIGSTQNEEAAVETAAPVEVETSEVLVAVRDIPRGVTLSADWFQTETMPVTDIPRGAFSSKADFERTGQGRRTLIEIASGDVLSEKLLLAPGMRASLSAKIEPGMRAYTIRTTDVSGVGGFVLPGDRVDVIFIEQRAIESLAEGGAGQASRAISPTSEVLLQNVEVLAVDLNDDMTGNDPGVFRTATLGVSLEQAQKLSVATELGGLSLALRGSADKAFEQAEAINLKDKPKPRQVAYRPSPPKRLQPKKAQSLDVEVVLGDQETTHTVPKSE
ncbi:Flp pilus assembly protein CpaB [Henriciella aquimarina]|uniref:Flp pilus assembly protein CpaB n=1 Tax=Henriciella aquimarina TaxID=545261 RepID=UPI0009FF5D73|nr:Flp pilus assembly protein CpaB [Henriciella aquimarina]